MSPDFTDKFPGQRLTAPLKKNDVTLSRQVQNRIDDLASWIIKGRTSKDGRAGYAALFNGPSGTGKTLAAAVLAHTTGLEVYRVDLGQVVSKYIGETEKNLSRVFERAEEKGWILFFDEADALFGKRTGLSSSHDRYANQEVSYLLERIEAHSGLVILVTNLRSPIDSAFQRRFQSVIAFGEPE